MNIFEFVEECYNWTPEELIEIVEPALDEIVKKVNGKTTFPTGSTATLRDRMLAPRTDSSNP